MTAPGARPGGGGGGTAGGGGGGGGGGRGGGGGGGASAAVPNGVGSPSVAMFSLIVPGTPSSALSGAPRSQRASLARACASAAPGRRREGACRCGSQRAICDSTACVTSTGDNWRWR